MDERRTEFSELKRVCPTKTKTQPKMMMRTKLAVVNLRTRKIVSISNLRQVMTKLAKDQYECIKFASRSKNTPQLSIDDDIGVVVDGVKMKIREVIRSFIIDAVVYGRGKNIHLSFLNTEICSKFVSCNFVLPEEIQSDPSLVKMTRSQCQGLQRSAFQFARFKRVNPTPNSENDWPPGEFLLDRTRSSSNSISSVGLSDTEEERLCPSKDPKLIELWNQIGVEAHYIVN
jgi:hypothetical protein